MPEHRHDPAQGDAVESIGRYWNALVDGQPLPADLEPSLAGTIQRLERIAGSPAPSPAFVTRLREDLLHAATAPTPLSVMALPSLNGRVSHANSAHAGR